MGECLSEGIIVRDREMQRVRRVTVAGGEEMKSAYHLDSDVYKEQTACDIRKRFNWSHESGAEVRSFGSHSGGS